MTARPVAKKCGIRRATRKCARAHVSLASMRSGKLASSFVSLNVSFRFFPLAAAAAAGAARFGGAASVRRDRLPLPHPVRVAADVFADAPAALEHERARDDVVEKRAVVADDEQRAGELEQQLLEQVERLDVEIVRRLVEHEQVERAREQPREQQAIALAARERAHRRARAIGREEEVLRDSRARACALPPISMKSAPSAMLSNTLAPGSSCSRS